MSELTVLGRDTWEEFLRSPLAVLVLAKTDCEHCAKWSSELTEFLAADESWPGVRFGKLYLDQPGLFAFKKAHPWIAEVDVLPFTAIFKAGERVKTFAGGGIDRLTARLSGILGASSTDA
jgi:hypothetical protein